MSEARAPRAEAGTWIKSGTVRVTDQVLPIGGDKFVLPVVQTPPLVGAAVEVSQRRIAPAQHEYRVRARLTRIETARNSRRQLIEPTKGNSFRFLTRHDPPLRPVASVCLLRSAARVPLLAAREQE